MVALRLLLVLLAPLVVPLVFYFETWREYIYVSEIILQLLLDVSLSLPSDLEIVKDAPTAILAVLAAIIAPSASSTSQTTMVLVFSVLGYFAFSVLGGQIRGTSFFVELDVGRWVEMSIRGLVDTQNVKTIREDLGDLISSLRFYYLVLACGAIGLTVKLKREEDAT